MADYQDIRGLRVKYLSADPSNLAAGEVWYNSTTGTLRSLLISEAWSSGASMIRTTTTGGGNHALGTGTQTAGLYAGGYSPYTNLTEEYNGVGWTAGGNMNLTRITAGFGTQTAAVAAGGITFPGTVGGQAEEYDGSTWTTGNALGTARAYVAGSGILTAGVAFGGSETANPTSVGNTEEYDGTSWAEQDDLTNGRRFLGSGGRGPQSAALGFGGNSAPTAYWTATESYNGTSWTNVNSMNTGRNNLGSAGDQTSALAFGGTTGSDSAATESWDGTDWSTSPATLANARTSQPSMGTSTAAVFVGGPNPLYAAGWVEEFNKSSSVITGATWASGGTLPAVRSGSSGAGTQTAALNIGGENGAAIFGTTEEYNGSSWAAGGDLNASPSFFMAAGGTQTAGIRAGGFTGPVGTDAQNAAEEYDGTSWTAVTAIPTATGNGMFAGIQTAGLFYGGSTPSVVTTSLDYNGTSWTATNSLAVAKSTGAGFGTQAAAIAAGGSNPGLGPGTTAFTNNTQIWDDTNWTTTGNLNNSRTNLRGWGSSTDGAVAGGRVPAPSSTAATESWDGSSWVTSANLGTGGYLGSTAGGPTAPSGLYAGGGRAPSNAASSATEEFTGETSALNIETLTTS